MRQRINLFETENQSRAYTPEQLRELALRYQWDMYFVIRVSHHFKFGSGHTQEGACQRALQQFIVCA